MYSFQITALACVLNSGFLGQAVQAVNIETIPVGHPGNAPDTRYAAGGYGAVGYEYNIGKFEVTSWQYVAFLNAVAATDLFGLYDEHMSSSHGCNIQRSGPAGGYTYSVDPACANRPVNYVSYWDSCRFANWLHNGQPSGLQGAGTTETGAYTLVPESISNNTVVRNADWRWAVTSEDEWYKAAYHKNDGVTDNYFAYPTSSDSIPSCMASPDLGNSATYYNGSYTIGGPYWRTEVGVHQKSGSPYGTFDQGGNVWEWNESVLRGWGRGLRGGAFDSTSDHLHASSRSAYSPAVGYCFFGFRIVQVPEPGTLVLLMFGGLALIWRH